MSRIRIALPRKQIEDFCLKWKVSEMAMFGSVLSEDFRLDSDIDVLVSFKNCNASDGNGHWPWSA
jgi:hypothetical protein